jgi:hypothetical protein
VKPFPPFRDVARAGIGEWDIDVATADDVALPVLRKPVSYDELYRAISSGLESARLIARA